jgi:hypothetical protein
MLGHDEFTPEDALERLGREYKLGGDAALDAFANAEPIMYIAAIEQSYREDGDFEGLEDYQRVVSEHFQKAVLKSIGRDGFKSWHRIVELARENGDDETADRIENFIEARKH